MAKKTHEKPRELTREQESDVSHFIKWRGQHARKGMPKLTQKDYARGDKIRWDLGIFLKITTDDWLKKWGYDPEKFISAVRSKLAMRGVKTRKENKERKEKAERRAAFKAAQFNLFPGEERDEKKDS